MTKHAKISNFQRYFFSKQNKSYCFIFFSKSHLQQYASFWQSLPLRLLHGKRTSSQTSIQYQRLPPTSQYGPQKKGLSWSNDCSFDHKRLFLKCWVNLKVSSGFFVCYQQNLFADIKGVFWKSIRCIWSSFFKGKNINACEKKWKSVAEANYCWTKVNFQRINFCKNYSHLLLSFEKFREQKFSHQTNSEKVLLTWKHAYV